MEAYIQTWKIREFTQPAGESSAFWDILGNKVHNHIKYFTYKRSEKWKPWRMLGLKACATKPDFWYMFLNYGGIPWQRW